VIKSRGRSRWKWGENLNKILRLKRKFENDIELRDSTKYGENLGWLNSYQLLRKTVVDEVSLITYKNIR
jgi:hypothetical protein